MRSRRPSLRRPRRFRPQLRLPSRRLLWSPRLLPLPRLPPHLSRSHPTRSKLRPSRLSRSQLTSHKPDPHQRSLPLWIRPGAGSRGPSPPGRALTHRRRLRSLRPLSRHPRPCGPRLPPQWCQPPPRLHPRGAPLHPQARFLPRGRRPMLPRKHFRSSPRLRARPSRPRSTLPFLSSHHTNR